MAREKRRNNEKRKQKSRDAARYRRSKETKIFTELSDCLPLTLSQTQQLDKASVMRLALSLLKINHVMDSVMCPDETKDYNGDLTTDQVMPNFSVVEEEEGEISQLSLKALEGTVVILSHDGDFVYLTDNVAKYVGLTQIDMMGQSIYDYIHPCDHDEIRNILNSKNTNSQVKQQNDKDLTYGEIKSFFIRMKSTLTAKGRSVNFKSAPFKVMKCCGRLVTTCEKDGCDGPTKASYLMAVLEPIPHPANIEVPLDSNTFLSKHEMDMHFVFCDERIEELAGYDHNAMVGQSFFDFYHAIDSGVIKQTFKDLFSKGQAVTPAYRMLAARGGYIWLVTQATTINSCRQQQPDSVVCVHYVLSKVEEAGIILSNIQQDLALPQLLTKTEVASPSPCMTPVTLLDEFIPPKLELNTEAIFTPKIKQMEESVNTPPCLVSYLSDDPDDLAYLSPMAGDEQIPVPFKAQHSDFLMSLMLPSMDKSPSQTLNSKQIGLLSPGASVSPAPSPSSFTSSKEYSQPSSPVDYMSSIMPLELDSIQKFFVPLESLEDGMQGIGTRSDQQVDKFVDNDLVDIDFALRAPYIPMDGDQDLDLLPPTPNALFNLSKDDISPSVFGRTEFVFRPKEMLYEEPKPAPKVSVRDMLGESTAVASIEQPPGTMYLQMKRPLDMNCLEKGPPVPKQARLVESRPGDQSSQISEIHNLATARGSMTKNSVLLNLLLTGEDHNYGYKVSMQQQPAVGHNKKQTSLASKLETLTRQDCEVNAPIPSGKLLQGDDLLTALDR